MAQTLAGVTISVDDKGLALKGEANYAFQDVLDSTTETISWFGAKSDRIHLVFVMDEDVNSNTGLSTLRTAYKTNAAVALVMHEGAWGDYRIVNFDAVQTQALNHTNRVWACQADLVSVD